MTESTITARGQTTVPAKIRLLFGAVPGTRLGWHLLTDGRLFVRVKSMTAQDVKGIVKVPKGNRLSIEEMKP